MKFSYRSGLMQLTRNNHSIKRMREGSFESDAKWKREDVGNK